MASALMVNASNWNRVESIENRNNQGTFGSLLDICSLAHKQSYGDPSLPLDVRKIIAQGSQFDFYDNRGGLFLAKMHVRTLADIAEIRARIEAVLAPLGHKIDVVVNYDQTMIEDMLAHDWENVVGYLEAHFYNRVTHYSTSAFLRRKLGQALQSHRRTAIFDSERAAEATQGTNER
ncbi:MAG: hypothetical protein ACTH3D_10755 [Halomonas sp.]|uniref:hypothetical protein n=1 Tax=Halomonas sp. TaxID=1486246 RepID=UPI003F9265B4